jgi:hypothetical protein
VFVLSPDPVASAVCDWEVNEAERLLSRRPGRSSRVRIGDAFAVPPPLNREPV